MKRLNDMSTEELMEQIGYIRLIPADIEEICVDDSKREIIDELYELAETKHDYELCTRKLSEYIVKNSDMIDKEKYLLIQVYRAEEIYNTTPEDERKLLEKGVKFCIEILKQNNSKKNICLLEREDNDVLQIKTINLNSLTNKKRSKKNEKRLKEIDEKIGLKTLIKQFKTGDLPGIFEIEDLGKRLSSIVALNTVRIEEGSNYQEGIEKYREDIEELNNLINNKYKEQYKENFIQEACKYAEYINVDKFLLQSSFRILNTLEEEKVSSEKLKEYKDLLEKIYETIENPKTKIFLYLVEEDEKDEKEEKVIEESFSKKDLKKELEKFYEGEYVGKLERKTIRKEILQEGKNLYNFTPFQVYSLEFKDEEIKKIVEDIENVKYLMTYNMINEELLKYILETRTEWPSEILCDLYKDGILTNKSILQMYEEEKINIENISKLKEEFDNDLQEILQDSQLLDRYKEYKQNTQNQEKRKMLERYALLYKELKIKGKTKEEIEEIGTNLIEELNEAFEENDLKEFYKLGLIDIETAVEWGGEHITNEMLIDRTLKPSDTKRLVEDKKIDINYIINLLKSNQMTEEEKLTLICSTFSDDNQADLRMELMQYLNFQEEKNYNKKENQNKNVRQQNNTGIKRNKYLMDPGSRWKLVTLLDEEYTQELMNDGHIIFKLPNVENGVIIIEKMFKKTKQNTVPSYGNATYIMKEEDFINYRSSIIEEDKHKNKKINRDKILELRENGKADKQVHSKNWGRSIKQYFKIEEESKYSEKQKEEIEKAIQSIEKSRVLE